MGQRPSAIIANSINELLKTIQEAQVSNPEAQSIFEKATADLKQIYESISNLDYLVLLGSQTDPNGLYRKVILTSDSPGFQKLKSEFKDPKKLYAFANLLTSAIDKGASNLPKFQPKQSVNKAKDMREIDPSARE